MLSLIEKEVVEKKKWIESEEMLDMLAISESTPGAISLNIATFVGVRVKGVLGALFATAGLVLPSFIVISVISLFIVEFLEIKVISYAFRGIRVGVVVLIANAFVKFAKGMKKDWFSLILFVAAFLLALFVTDLDIVFIILGAMVIGIGYGILRKAIAKRRNPKTPLAELNEQEADAALKTQEKNNESEQAQNQENRSRDEQLKISAEKLRNKLLEKGGKDDLS